MKLEYFDINNSSFDNFNSDLKIKLAQSSNGYISNENILDNKVLNNYLIAIYTDYSNKAHKFAKENNYSKCQELLNECEKLLKKLEKYFTIKNFIIVLLII